MSILNQHIPRRNLLKVTITFPILSLTVTLQPKPLPVKAAQPVTADGYGLGIYNEGTYPAHQHNIYLPLVAKGV